MGKKTSIDEKWIREITRSDLEEEDKYTFCGVLEYRYNHIARYWNAETRRKHEREYNNIILPALKNHDDKTIREYTRSDYEEAIESIKERGYEQQGIVYPYSESSIRNFENLIYYVVFQASVYGLCDNVLWGTKFVLDMPDESDEIEERVTLKKSLSVAQEKRFCREVMSDVAEDGAVVALLIMWALGPRNGEACGLNYGDIKQLEGHPDCYTVWIYKSTKIKSSELQSGGKTYNTGRIVPVSEKLLDFLNERKALVCKIAESQGVEVDIDSLPICCDGELDWEDDNYLNRCKADRVTMAAHEVFENAGISPKMLAFLDAELAEGNTAAVLKEKEPTAYLLRRNFATQMCILGLSYPEMQYLMGHDVEDAYESRNEFVDSDRIYSMHLKLKQRQLLNHVENNNKKEIFIQKNKTTKVHISAHEPTDVIKASVSSCNDGVSAKWFEEKEDSLYGRSINILNVYCDNYD